jgi:hypothetical protein
LADCRQHPVVRQTPRFRSDWCSPSTRAGHR